MANSFKNKHDNSVSAVANLSTIKICDDSDKRDLKISLRLSPLFDTSLIMEHYKNGDYFFHYGSIKQLSGFAYLIKNNGKIYRLLFLYGHLLYQELLLDECEIGNFSLPRRDDIDLEKTIVKDKEINYFNFDNKQLFTVLINGDDISINFVSNMRQINISTNNVDKNIEIKFSNDDGKLFLDDIKYFIDGYLEYSGLNYSSKNKKFIPENIPLEPLLENALFNGIDILNKYLDKI